ncbi:MAG: hypothetical protein KAH72_09235, partial [Flavobacteriaceae bacterium]|nr:hypothetical protein [Flavobacteriaceae bacterium]
MRIYILMLLMLLQWNIFSQEKDSETFGLLTEITPFKSDKDQVFLNTLLRNLKPGDTLKLKPGFYT